MNTRSPARAPRAVTQPPVAANDPMRRMACVANLSMGLSGTLPISSRVALVGNLLAGIEAEIGPLASTDLAHVRAACEKARQTLADELNRPAVALVGGS